jgi:toxin FitB
VIVLDTNVISELMKLKPSSRVFDWVSAQPSHALFTTAINQAEILMGLELLPAGKRRQQLGRSAGEMFEQKFADRILPFDSRAARRFALVAIERRKSGRPISQTDAQIAAIARSHGAAIATRNVADFLECGIAVIDPWS